MAKVRGSFTDFVDFSRASEATYLGSDGLLKTATNNEPRVEYDVNGQVKGLLIEEQRTNLITYSEASVANWGVAGSGVTKTDVSVSALGFNTGVEYVANGNDWHGLNSPPLSVSDATNYVAQAWIKKGTSANWSIRLRDGTKSTELIASAAWGSATITETGSTAGTVLSSGVTYYDNNTVAHVWMVLSKSGADPDAYVRVGPFSSVAGESITVLAAQLEQGSFPTSYIPTSGATATRSADIADIATANFGYNQKAGTVVVEASQLQNISGDYNSIVNFGSSSSNRIDIGALNNNGFQSIRESGADSVQYDQNASQNINAYAGGEVSVVALSFNSRSANSSMNGTNGTEDTSVIVPTASVVKVGNDYSSRYLNGHIRSIKYLPRRLSNTQLQEFTS